MTGTGGRGMTQDLEARSWTYSLLHWLQILQCSSARVLKPAQASFPCTRHADRSCVQVKTAAAANRLLGSACGLWPCLLHVDHQPFLVQNMVQAGAAAADAATATEEATVSYMDSLREDGQAPQDATSPEPSQASHTQPAGASPG